MISKADINNLFNINNSMARDTINHMAAKAMVIKVISRGFQIKDIILDSKTKISLMDSISKKAMRILPTKANFNLRDTINNSPTTLHSNSVNSSIDNTTTHITSLRDTIRLTIMATSSKTSNL